jgi:hypothetical protein
LFLVEQLGPERYRRWILPGAQADVRAAAQELEARGMRVAYERGVVVTLAAVLGGTIVFLGLRVVSAVLVLAAFANLVLFALGRGGSLGRGVALLVAAVAAAVGVQLLGALLRRAPA